MLFFDDRVNLIKGFEGSYCFVYKIGRLLTVIGFGNMHVAGD